VAVVGKPVDSPRRITFRLVVARAILPLGAAVECAVCRPASLPGATTLQSADTHIADAPTTIHAGVSLTVVPP